MNTYPSTPLGDNIAASARLLSTGKLITYAGYGFTATYSGVTAILLDGVSLGAPPSPLNKYDVPLNLHRVEFQPNTCTISNFQGVI